MKASILSAIFAGVLVLSGCVSEPATTTVDQNKTGTTPAAATVACTEELQRCPDGTAVGRNPANSCAFDACPNGQSAVEEKICTMDAKVCPDGSSVGRDGKNNCEFKPCK